MIKQMMNPVVKKKWLKALRSGDYLQGKEKLLSKKNHEDRFCCLGVLCNLYAQEHPGTGFKYNDDEFLFNEVSGTMPEDVAKWADINNQVSGTIYVNPESGEAMDAEDLLIYMNDNANKNFNEIADWIEENL